MSPTVRVGVSAGWLVLTAACGDGATPAGTSAPITAVQEPSASSTAIAGVPLKTAATAAVSARAPRTFPGRSALPSVAEWNAAAEVTVKGSSALGCETKMVREWLRVLCRGKNDSGGAPTRVLIVKGADAATHTQASAGETSLVTPFIDGVHLAAQFSWTDKSHPLTIDWPTGKPSPAILGVFEGAKSPLDRLRATCAGKRKCPEDKPVCLADQQGPRCAAWDSAEYHAASSNARFQCTHQSDCVTEEGCFFTFGEHDVVWRTYCGDYRGGQAACDMTKNCDEKTDDTCVPCVSLELPGLPWLGLH